MTTQAHSALVSPGPGAGLVLALGILASCSQDKIDVSPPATTDHGLAAVETAVARILATDKSPEDFRRLHREIEAARPEFNLAVHNLADRKLAFLGLPALASVLGVSADHQLDQLALTVWPTAFGVEPTEGETPTQYVERLCGDTLKHECGDLVPEYWAPVVNAAAWHRFHARARAAVSECPRCRQDPSYKSAMGEYRTTLSRLTLEASRARHRGHPTTWPKTGAHAQAYSNDPLLAVYGDGRTTFDGLEVGDWQLAIASNRTGSMLGVHLRPTERVRRLAVILRAARRAGYSAIALVTRQHQFPYPLRQYRLTTLRGVGVSMNDSIQSLVNRLSTRPPANPTKPVSLAKRPVEN